MRYAHTNLIARDWRAERAGEEGAIRRVNELAFGQPAEADLVEALRAAGAVTLSLVALRAGSIVGHILFSPVTVETERGPIAAIGLAPMAVLPEAQREGIGSALVEAGLAALRGAGHRLVFVLGHPGYYPRFGFGKASEHGIRWEREAKEEAFMVLELAPEALPRGCGVVRYRPEFDGV